MIIDEFLALLDMVPQLGDLFITLWQEARKVGIRIICLIHGDEVKALKIEGRGSIRACLRYLRLADFALSHAKKLRNPQLSRWLKQEFKAGNHPCLIEDAPAMIPSVEHLVPPEQRSAVATLERDPDEQQQNQLIDEVVQELEADHREQPPAPASPIDHLLRCLDMEASDCPVYETIYPETLIREFFEYLITKGQKHVEEERFYHIPTVRKNWWETKGKGYNAEAFLGFLRQIAKSGLGDITRRAGKDYWKQLVDPKKFL